MKRLLCTSTFFLSLVTPALASEDLMFYINEITPAFVVIAFIVHRFILAFVGVYLAANKGYKDGAGWGFFLGYLGIFVVGVRADRSHDKPASAVTTPQESNPTEPEEKQ